MRSSLYPGSRRNANVCWNNDLSRAIARVAKPERPVVGIMTGLSVFGEAPSIMMHPGQNREEEWAFISELEERFYDSGKLNYHC